MKYPQITDNYGDRIEVESLANLVWIEINPVAPGEPPKEAPPVGLTVKQAKKLRRQLKAAIQDSAES